MLYASPELISSPRDLAPALFQPLSFQPSTCKLVASAKGCLLILCSHFSSSDIHPLPVVFQFFIFISCSFLLSSIPISTYSFFLAFTHFQVLIRFAILHASTYRLPFHVFSAENLIILRKFKSAFSAYKIIIAANALSLYYVLK